MDLLKPIALMAFPAFIAFGIWDEWSARRKCGGECLEKRRRRWIRKHPKLRQTPSRDPIGVVPWAQHEWKSGNFCKRRNGESR